MVQAERSPATSTSQGLWFWNERYGLLTDGSFCVNMPLTWPPLIANSDRRPVDPPPVVELKIFEGDPKDKKEITFDYNAHFFLYASLELARPIAHGRNMPPASQNPPILTGVPAAGMAYLDRPNAAGYFIFPDLSVRHEGSYRLSFSLFETTKEEKDFDREPVTADLQSGVDWRMEVKTRPFSVYSAKKFPGLMESTSLSKVVADQGCRVRIRRDVRMRKRDGKSGGGRREDEVPRPRTVTPACEDPRLSRARSTSGASEQRVPYPGEQQRRPSAVDGFVQPGPPPPPSAPAYDNASSSRGHLAFGDSKGPQFATPSHVLTGQSHQVIPASPSRLYAQSPRTKMETHYTHSRAASHVSSSPALPAIKPEPFEQRQSHAQIPPAAQPFSSANARLRWGSNTYTPPIAAPLMAQQYSERTTLPPMEPIRPLKIQDLISPIPPIEAQSDPRGPPPSTMTGSKRKHDIVFSQNSRSLHNGQRQLDPHFDKFRRGISQEPDLPTYQRADGKIMLAEFNQFY